MKFTGIVTSSETRVIHYGLNKNPQPEQRWIYLDMPQMQHSHLMLRDDDRHFLPGNKIELEIKKVGE